MERGRGPEIVPPDHMADPLRGIVVDHGEVIGRIAGVLADEDRIAGVADQVRAIDDMLAGMERPGLAEGQRRGAVERAGEVEAQRVARPSVRHGAAAAGARIDQPLASRACPGLGDGAAGAAAGIEQPARRQPVRGGEIGRAVLGLPPHRPVPTDPEPAQVLEEARLVLRAAAGAVGVLDSDEERAARLAGHALGGQGAKRMAEMQRAGGRGGETRADGHSAAVAGADWGAAAGVPCAASQSCQAALARSV